jgi:hypothetical protein
LLENTKIMTSQEINIGQGINVPIDESLPIAQSLAGIFKDHPGICIHSETIHNVMKCRRNQGSGEGDSIARMHIHECRETLRRTTPDLKIATVARYGTYVSLRQDVHGEIPLPGLYPEIGNISLNDNPLGSVLSQTMEQGEITFGPNYETMIIPRFPPYQARILLRLAEIPGQTVTYSDMGDSEDMDSVVGLVNDHKRRPLHPADLVRVGVKDLRRTLDQYPLSQQDTVWKVVTVKGGGYRLLPFSAEGNVRTNFRNVGDDALKSGDTSEIVRPLIQGGLLSEKEGIQYLAPLLSDGQAELLRKLANNSLYTTEVSREVLRSLKARLVVLEPKLTITHKSGKYCLSIAQQT